MESTQLSARPFDTIVLGGLAIGVAIGRWPTFSIKSTLNGIIGHAFLVGLPVALIASWSAGKTARDQN